MASMNRDNKAYYYQPQVFGSHFILNTVACIPPCLPELNYFYQQALTDGMYCLG